MKPYAFAGGTAVVTGAGSGIGEALAYALAGRGSRLVLIDQPADRLDRVLGRLGREHPGQRLRAVVADSPTTTARSRSAPGWRPSTPRRRCW